MRADELSVIYGVLAQVIEAAVDASCCSHGRLGQPPAWRHFAVPVSLRNGTLPAAGRRGYRGEVDPR